MGIAFSLLAQVEILGPAGALTISLSDRGLVAVKHGPFVDPLDYLKAAKGRVRTGGNPHGFVMMSDPAPQTRGWWKKMLAAAEDAVRRFQNDQAEFAPLGYTLDRGTHKLRLTEGRNA